MRRFLTLAVLGLAVATATDASAQGRRGGRRAGADSVRAARDTAFRRRGPDSLRAKRLDSLHAAGALDTVRGGRRGAGPDGRGGPGGRGGLGPMGGRGGLMGIQLNDNEKDAVKQINEKYRTEMEQFREANKDKRP